MGEEQTKEIGLTLCPANILHWCGKHTEGKGAKGKGTYQVWVISTKGGGRTHYDAYALDCSGYIRCTAVELVNIL